MERAIRALNGMLKDGILQDYAIGGAMAALFYAEPVATYDLDVYVVLPGDPSRKAILTLDSIYEYAKRKGYVVDQEHIMIKGVPVQLLPVYNDLVEEAVREAVETRYGAEMTRVVGPEHLLAIMASVGRPKDRIRAAAMLTQAKVDRKRLQVILKRHGLTAKWRKILGEADRG